MDYGAIDKAAYRTMCKEFLVEVMQTAIHHETRGHYEITETNREKLSYAVEGAKFYREEAVSNLMRSRYYALESAIRTHGKL